jgi:hypothetical protein
LGEEPMSKTAQVLARACVALIAMAGGPAICAEFELGDVEGKYTLIGNYAAVQRMEDPDNRIIDAPGDPRIPVAEDLKFPQSNNFDDGDRNFRKGDLVNNRLTFIGDLELNWRNYGLLLRGDAFYDDVYHGRNAHDAPDRINTTQEPFNSFTDAAEKFSGARKRLLDAYAFANLEIAGRPINIRGGRHIAAWGQSLFFYGVALSQSSADATRATIPGSDVKSILLPNEQISFRMALTPRLSLLGQYHLEFKPFEINPVGEFYSVTDLVGPGREFAYGFRNPFYLDNLAPFDLTDPADLADIVMTIDSVFDGQLQTDGLENFLLGLPIGSLPTISLPITGANPLNAPEGLNPAYAGEIRPKGRQYGLGATYALTETTELGAYYLRYHQKTPAVLLNFGELTLIPSQEVVPGVTIPALTTADLGLVVPESYNIGYFDNVDLYAVSFSTLLFGWNVGGELIRREGVDVLIDVDEGVNGIVPQPSRANTNQLILNAIYSGRPPFFFDTVILVGELGWIQAKDIEGVQSHEGANAGQTYRNLTADDEAYAISLLSYLDKSNVLEGWDLRIPLSYQQALKGRTPLNAGFGSLFDEQDIRLGVGLELTRLQKLTLGINYSGFLGGKPHFFDRPLQDRDNIGINVKYSFL